MSKNTGVSSEKIFEGFCSSVKAVAHKFVDTKAARNKVTAQPADYLVLAKEGMGLHEVKSVSSGTSFPFGNIGRMQNMVANLCDMFGYGDHYIFNIHKLDTDEWFFFTARDYAKVGKRSIKFTEMRRADKIQAYNDSSKEKEND